jgi:hypothetical protein
VSDEWEIGVVSEGDDLLVDHESEDSELGGTSVVELDGTLGHLLFFGEGIPSEVDVSVTEVTNEFVSGVGDVTHDGAFEESNEGDQLDKSSSGDGIGAREGGDSIGERREGVSGVVNVSWKVDSSTGDNLSKEGKLTDTSVLDLDVTETVETVLVGSVEESHRIPASKRSLGTEFVFEGIVQSRGGGLLGGRGEGSSRGEKGGEDGELHDFISILSMFEIVG